MPPSGFLNLTARSDVVVRLDPLRGRAAPDRRPWVIRPEDLLVLDVERVNLKVVPGERGAPAQLVRDRGGLAYLIVTFPPQHVAESAYHESEPGEPGFGPSLDPPPIPAVIAGWSRLVFRVTDERLPIPWTLEGVLRAMTDLELSLPANAAQPPPPPLMAGSLGSLIERANRVGPSPLASLAAGSAVSAARARRQLRQSARSLGLTESTGRATAQLHRSLTAVEAGGIPPFLARPGPQPPALTETAIEFPHELFLAPDPSARWSHAVAPARSSETGHTELWHTRLDTGGAGGHGLRAVWTTAQDPPPAPDPALPTLQSLLPRHKRNIVDLTSNYGLPSAKDPRRFYEPRPVRADLLMLSSLGAGMNARGVWDEHPVGVDVEEWRHRATLGRDHYVRIVEAGYLLPWGHRASLITVTERRFHSDRAGHPAYLRQRKLIIVREPVKAYRDTGHTYQGADALRHGEQLDLMLPFERVQVATLVTPALDQGKDDVGGKGEQCFWPRVGGQLLKFHLKATDVLGNEIELAMPLVFVIRSLVEGDFMDEAAAAYGVALQPGSSTLRATVAAGGARVAFAESAGPDDTTFPAQSLTFGAEVSRQGPAQGVRALVPPFLPVLRGAAIDVPSLQGIARTARPVSISFASAYLLDAFGGPNAGQVFLAADQAMPSFDVAFSGQADRTGALVTPDLRLSGLSRITGPVAGSLVHAAQGSFRPDEWFKDIMSASLSPSLFGVLSLKDIVEVAGFHELDKLPRFAGQMLDPVESLLEQLERLRERLATDSAPDTAAASALVRGLIDPGTGSIPALLNDGPVATVVARLASLDVELARLSGHAVGSPPTGTRAALLQVAGTVRGGIGRVLAEGDGLLQRFAGAGALPRAVQSRLEWRPLLTDRSSTFKPRGDHRNLTLAVEAAGEAFTSTCSLVDFDLELEFLRLGFEHVHFRAQAGRQAEVDVALDNIAFAGALSFVETLRDLIPLDGFSDKPGVTVTPEGITAAVSAGLPNIAVGVFSLENLSLAAGFTLPFAGPPMSVWFRFCERENPARLTVGLFGGGFFVGLTANAKGLAVVEGAIEFGAAAAVDLGVVAGSMSMMAGLYFKIQDGDLTLAGYFRMRGMVKAFGIVSVTIEMYLEMRYEQGSGKCTGTATIEVEVDVTLFSVSASVTCTKKFAGSGNADPTLAQMFDVAPDATSADWNQYCAAFA